MERLNGTMRDNIPEHKKAGLSLETSTCQRRLCHHNINHMPPCGMQYSLLPDIDEVQGLGIVCVLRGIAWTPYLIEATCDITCNPFL